MSALSEHGPRVVAIGGGHGLARSLGAIRHYASSVTAVVSVADDGGSSGRLRDALGIAAPGDIRRCLGALLPTDSLLGRTLEHRFSGGDLEGHAFGNLLIAALVATCGDFTSGIQAAGALLQTVGPVYPATDCPVVLKADGVSPLLEGQARIAATGGVSAVSLVPPDAGTPHAAVAALMQADQIVIGPGSLYTSLLAALIAPAVAVAVRESPAQVVYVANLREQVPETAGYDVGDHVGALIAHGVRPDVVCADVAGIALGKMPGGTAVHTVHLASANGLTHDEGLLAAVLGDLAS